MSGASISTTEAEASDLRAIIADAIAAETLDARALDRILRRYPKAGRGFYTKREVLAEFRASAGAWPIAEATFAERLRTTPTRTLSGVAPVAVLPKPFPCPGRCVFCPIDVRMPKSYLANEPGCQRAQANRFDPYLQAWNRLTAFRAMGHSTAKVELIVLGGTWSFYPESYQVWFATRLFEALNDFAAGVDRRAEVAAFAPDFSALAPSPRGYDASVAAHLRAGEADGRRLVLTTTTGDTTTDDLFLLNGGEMRRLTREARDDLQGNWSPDGRWIAYLTARWSEPGDDDYDLAVLDPASGEVRRLTSSHDWELNLSWSPDGSRIATARRFREPVPGELCIVSFDGTTESCREVPGFEVSAWPAGWTRAQS